MTNEQLVRRLLESDPDAEVMISFSAGSAHADLPVAEVEDTVVTPARPNGVILLIWQVNR